MKNKFLKLPKAANKAPTQIGDRSADIQENHQNASLAQSQNSRNSNYFNKLPDELASTFDKMIQQLDIVARTMKIMEQRIQTIEGQVTELYQIKKGIVEQGEEYYPNTNNVQSNIPNEEINEVGMNSGNLNMGMNMDEEEYRAKYESDGYGSQNMGVGNSQEMNLQGSQEVYIAERIDHGEEGNEEMNNLQQENMPIDNNTPIEVYEDNGDHVEEVNNAAVENQ